MNNNPYPAIHTNELVLHDEAPEETRLERLDFHLKTGDYFPMLATILGFVQETVEECACGVTKALVPIEADVIKGTREDLMYLHKNYRIVPCADGECPPGGTDVAHSL